MAMGAMTEERVRSRTPREVVAPARGRKLQISLTPEERRALTERARAGGYDSVAAYVRARTIGQPVTA